MKTRIRLHILLIPLIILLEGNLHSVTCQRPLNSVNISSPYFAYTTIAPDTTNFNKNSGASKKVLFQYQNGNSPRRNLNSKLAELRQKNHNSSQLSGGTFLQDRPPNFDEPKQDPVKMIKAKINNRENENQIIDTPETEDVLGVKCTFENECNWTWNETLDDGFKVVTGSNLSNSNLIGPTVDTMHDTNGHFLHLRLHPTSGQQILRSPQFASTRDKCVLEVFVHQSSMSKGSLRVVIEPSKPHESSWISGEIAGNDLRRWELKSFPIGRITKEIRILFEVVPNNDIRRGHVSIDNLKMRNCFPDRVIKDNCSEVQVKCSANKMDVCMNIPRICDINVDCDNSEDEQLNCDKIPFGGICDFENGWCGWQNSGRGLLLWARNSGPTPTEKTGPDSDHTYQHTNVTGHYMFVNMNQHSGEPKKSKIFGFASNAIMNSIVFNPPPLVHSNASSIHRNSCVIRYYVHQYGFNPGSINLSVVEMKHKENVTTTLWWSSKNQGEDWIRVELPLPNITSRYFLQFEARMGMRIYSDVAIDDFSLSPECFGLNIPIEYLHGYNYWDPRIGINKQSHKDFSLKNGIELTPCGAKGIAGPTAQDCVKSYNGTQTGEKIKVLEMYPHKGTQVYTVPNEGYYTIIAKGAGGGLGSGGVGSSRGAIIVSVLELHKDEKIHFIIGQSGQHACIKSMGQRDEVCDSKPEIGTKPFLSTIKQVKQIVIANGAGGGGGGTFGFLILNKDKEPVPLIIAGGGGGLGIGTYINDDQQHGKGINFTFPIQNFTGVSYLLSNVSAGPGGGWTGKNINTIYGTSLLEGSLGGVPCYETRGMRGEGGFGGGGGGCTTGGGGGGFNGGDINVNMTNGEGGSSYLNHKRTIPELSAIYPGGNSGDGSVFIIPAIEGCGCDYRCVALDEFMSVTSCICPEGWILKSENETSCELMIETPFPLETLIIVFAVTSVLLIAALTGLILMLYNRYQRKKQAAQRHKMLIEQDLQLSRLRHTADDSALTNFNPNYGCDGILNGNVDVKSLPQVARESLRLVKALGQGAFGEVYQGLYRHRDGDAVEMPVAVKTLPEMSTGQAEADFLMEAAIMAKFNHPNIVHLIGVCFDRHPRFIVLELLAGGDLKNFLREGRNKPERPSPLTMKDLVFCALDVAKGCRYMESKRFIHRDIAARNCLLSSKGPGRVVKIADFGMARDIYRSDYYRKGGKAMLPIKWMPPEAFLDGIFTSKTDVWSFGVLLWEVFSLGLMPYTGLPNRDVMQLVTGGGRLDAPPGCPIAIYRIMKDCWNPTPEERPSFSNILERLTACTQDPDVMNAPLPSFFRPPSTERDQTIMRPPGNDNSCLQAPNTSDYLIPLPPDKAALSLEQYEIGIRNAAERLLLETTGVTMSEATYNAPKIISPAIPQKLNDGSWETSFMLPNSNSNEPLLKQNGEDFIKRPESQGSLDRQLISLDTPQQTPTTKKPPISFGVPSPHPHLDEQLNKKQFDVNLTLDPAALNNHCIGLNNTNSTNFHDKITGNGNNKDGKGAAFTIQGFNERYMGNNENHSEISC